MSVKKLLFFCLAFSSLVRGEFLVVERLTGGEFAPVSPGNPDAAKIADILFSFQWPMSVMNTHLTKQEKDELLAPDILYAEEHFIRKKLQKLGNYDVIFIPTVVYELFCLHELVDIHFHALERPFLKDFNPFQIAAIKLNYDTTVMLSLKKMIHNPLMRDSLFLRWREILNLYLWEADTSRLQLQEYINEGYSRIFDLFYKESEAFFYMNQKFFNFLLKTYPEIVSIKESSGIADFLRLGAYDLTFRILKSKKVPGVILQKELGLDGLLSTGIIAQVINLEYEARLTNKALLLRGANEFFQTFNVEGDKVPLFSSTLRRKSSGDEVDSEVNIMALFKKRNIIPYSLSFGNSLFAGTIRDKGACVYDFFTKSEAPILGYVLFINKRAYLNNQNNYLDMIAPLPSLAALISEGEFFHSRTKISLKSIKKRIKATGLDIGLFTDTQGFLTVERDPFEHEKLFMKFFVDNAALITHYQVSAEERKHKEAQIKALHVKALRFHLAFSRLSRFFKIYADQAKAFIQARRAAKVEA